MADVRVRDAVVVGGTNLGEADRIVRLLTAEEGRVSALARHARASRRRFGGLLDTGARLRVTLAGGRGDLEVLRDADLVTAPRRARETLERVALLSYGCEVVARLTPEGEAAPKLHRLLVAWLDRLEATPPPGDAVRVALEAKAATFAGLAPVLLACAVCGEPLADPACFSHEAGGALHARCGGGAPIAAATLAVIEGLRRTPLAEVREAGETSGGSPLPPAARWLLSDFLRWHLGRDLASRALLEELG